MTTTSCQYCGGPLDEGAVLTCTDCGTPHHRDCFRENQGCTTYGCGTTAAKQALAPFRGLDLSGSPRNLGLISVVLEALRVSLSAGQDVAAVFLLQVVAVVAAAATSTPAVAAPAVLFSPLLVLAIARAATGPRAPHPTTGAPLGRLAVLRWCAWATLILGTGLSMLTLSIAAVVQVVAGVLHLLPQGGGGEVMVAGLLVVMALWMAGLFLTFGPASLAREVAKAAFTLPLDTCGPHAAPPSETRQIPLDPVTALFALIPVGAPLLVAPYARSLEPLAGAILVVVAADLALSWWTLLSFRVRVQDPPALPPRPPDSGSPPAGDGRPP